MNYNVSWRYPNNTIVTDYRNDIDNHSLDINEDSIPNVTYNNGFNFAFLHHDFKTVKKYNITCHLYSDTGIHDVRILE